MNLTNVCHNSFPKLSERPSGRWLSIANPVKFEDRGRRSNNPSEIVISSKATDVNISLTGKKLNG